MISSWEQTEKLRNVLNRRSALPETETTERDNLEKEAAELLSSLQSPSAKLELGKILPASTAQVSTSDPSVESTDVLNNASHGLVSDTSEKLHLVSEDKETQSTTPLRSSFEIEAGRGPSQPRRDVVPPAPFPETIRVSRSSSVARGSSHTLGTSNAMVALEEDQHENTRRDGLERQAFLKPKCVAFAIDFNDPEQAQHEALNISILGNNYQQFSSVLNQRALELHRQTTSAPVTIRKGGKELELLVPLHLKLDSSLENTFQLNREPVSKSVKKIVKKDNAIQKKSNANH